MTPDIFNFDPLEPRFRNLFSEAPFSAALLSGVDFVVEMANEVTLDLWGKDSSIIGKPLLDAMPEMKDQKVFHILKDVYETGKTYEGKEHVAYLMKNEVLTKVYVNLVYKPIRDDNNRVTGVLAVGYDVTDQVVATSKLKQSETRARVAIESAGLGTFELDYQSGNIITSQKFDEIFGFNAAVTREQYLSRIHPEDLPIRNAAHEQALKTGKLFYEARILLPGNSFRWVKINGLILYDKESQPECLIGTILDITEEKLSLKRIEESEARFRTLITETPEVGAGLYLGRELRVQYVNPVMLSFWGKKNFVAGTPLNEVVPELSGQPFLELLDQVFTTGLEYTGKEEKALLNRNGKLETFYYNYTYKPLRDLAGKVYAIHHMAIDVTEQVETKLKLIEREQSVKNLFEQTPIGIATFKGKDLVIEMVNQTLLEYWGRKREEVINKSAWVALPELVDQGIKGVAEEVFRTGVSFSSPETSLTLLRNGKKETIVVRFGFQAIKDWQGKITGLLAIANEVTDLVNARRKVEKDEMRWEFLANSMPQVVWIAKGDGTVIYYNDRVNEFAGVKRNEDGSWVWAGIVHPDDFEVTNRIWSDSVKNKIPYEIEHRIMMKNGSYRWHLSRAYYYDTDDGPRWYGTATDVHDQKELEMNLENIVRERTVELQRSNDDLQQFAHVASHDLKEPVRKVQTFAYKLQDEFTSILNERGNNFVNKILNASNRMNSMINGVLNYASVTASTNNFERTDLNTILVSIQTDLEILIHEKNASVTFHELPIVNGIPALLYQLFYNLINNSLKFAKQNLPASIEITSSEVVQHEKQFYKITLTDNGIGFDKTYAEEIFSTFFRLNSKDQYEGSGLGLALCKKIAERHGGKITATGEPGKGAEFSILLPH